MTVHERLDRYRADVLVKVGRQTHNGKMIARGIAIKMARLKRKDK
jgi:hypothetical protein